MDNINVVPIMAITFAIIAIAVGIIELIILKRNSK
jgi:hypothetical protein